MLGNIIDRRSDRLNPNIDAVFEPGVHDDQGRAGERFFDWDDTARSSDYFSVTWQYGLTIRAAALRAERDWPFPVTVFLYDPGSAPAG
jgi:hypothetical protein